jgi:hypothetical protein
VFYVLLVSPFIGSSDLSNIGFGRQRFSVCPGFCCCHRNRIRVCISVLCSAFAQETVSFSHYLFLVRASSQPPRADLGVLLCLACRIASVVPTHFLCRSFVLAPRLSHSGLGFSCDEGVTKHLIPGHCAEEPTSSCFCLCPWHALSCHRWIMVPAQSFPLQVQARGQAPLAAQGARIVCH